MDRRHLLLAVGLASSTLIASRTRAAGPKASGDAPVVMGVSGLGLPIIVDGRLRNYVLVGLSLDLAPGVQPQDLREREPYLRDAVVRVAHRRPFVVPMDWNVIDAPALEAAILRMSVPLFGGGKVTAAKVTNQMPRNWVRTLG